MLSRVSIRWRITLFHILTMLGIAGLLAFGMFVVFSIAGSNFAEESARSRANEAARIVEHTGTLTEADLASLNRDSVYIIAMDGEGTVVAQIGAGLMVGEVADRAIWGASAETGKPGNTGERSVFEKWDDDADYVHTEPVASADSAIRFVAAGVNYDHVGETQYQWVTLAFIGFGLLAFVLIIIGSIALVRYSLAPVRAIADAASEISAADLSLRLPVDTPRDELGQLATSVNDLLDRLESAFADREEALAHQRRFVADASHELRTPLTSILGYARLLKQWGLDNPEASAEAVARMESEGQRMEALVGGLLQLARGDEAGTQHLARENLVEIVREGVVTASAVEPDRVRIATEVAAGPMWAMVDGDAFLQVGAILLDNARKYAPDRSMIAVVLDREGDDAVLTVTDRGPGIAPEHHERIFERFYRVDASRTTRGAGLGLAIARDIVERHRGTLAVSSVPGHGATFTVRILLDLKPGSTESVP